MLKLGKLAPKHDTRTLKLSNYLDAAALPTIPVAVDYQDSVPASAWTPLLNDQIGDCAIACPLHMVQDWVGANKGTFTPTNAQALAAYSAVSGYNPNSPLVHGENPTDVGCVLLNVNRYWQKTGIGGHVIGAYAAVDFTNPAEVKAASYIFDGVSLGVALPLAYQTATDWLAPTGTPTGQWAPGSWGGHNVPVLGFDANYVYVCTWGQIKRMSWHAFATYVDEAWAIFSGDWFSPANIAPNGFAWADLAADLATITGTSGPPVPTPIVPPAPPAPSPVTSVAPIVGTTGNILIAISPNGTTANGVSIPLTH